MLFKRQGDECRIPGRARPKDALQQALEVDHLVNEEGDIATVAGLVIAANGHIPRVGDVIDVP
ncbi:hypothetical protein MJM43_31220, partial [Salmonella enterica subsp. enterica serovar Montevideo]|nr:hypothetical protein [Salmonella enterica subsp. enterica serovar Montevideo]